MPLERHHGEETNAAREQFPAPLSIVAVVGLPTGNGAIATQESHNGDHSNLRSDGTSQYPPWCWSQPSDLRRAGFPNPAGIGKADKVEALTNTLHSFLSTHVS